MKNWFPLGIAFGDAFCNRVDERVHLKHNVLHGTHTLIASPRRYGKTSLANQVISELGLTAATMELTLVSDLITTQKIMSAAIGRLLLHMAPTHKKALILANQFFSQLNPKLIIDTAMGAKIEFTPTTLAPHLSIMDLLLNVDQAAIAAKKKIILFMDEFQQIALLDDHLTLEAAIRNAAQRLTHTSIIFSGSNRHLLQLMFDDQSRPLYHLCDRLNIRRIQENDYIPYIQKVATKRWHDKLAATSLQLIFQLTARHPYYMNVLCGRLYRCEQLPTPPIIQTTWEDYIDEEGDRIGKEMAMLSHHQRMMLLLFATESVTQPSSKEVTNKLRISTASAAKCSKTLLENDYIYQEINGRWRVTDPAVETYLKRQRGVLI